ncbi:vascular-related unknown protein 1 [Mercurialis annua]|uniref:vascular-related unknown protein 1 n=1 Tax=Mercurialis annua TaxID=3986 RepID=UPI00215F4DB0|nr:vascular-related unknown protein 1 [Mercurialis annua]
MDTSMDHSSPMMNIRTNSCLDEEESGWTAYFEDFSADQRRNNDEEHSFSCSFGNSSMVSDAASIPAWINKSNTTASNIYDHNYINNKKKISSFGADGSPKFAKKLILKKTRAKEIYHDDSLEDTASSPVNSPKVSEFGMADMNSGKTNDHFNSSLGKGGILEEYGLETNERCERSYSGNNIDNTNLKKRGLCLVPMSMLVNYLG